MNEQELKSLWQNDPYTPMINFAEIRRIATAWEEKLRRKARIDTWAQIISVIFAFLLVLYFPKMLVAAVMIALFGVWYIYELRDYYKTEVFEIDDGISGIKQSLQTKLETMKNRFRRKRIAFYLSTPPVMIATLYGFFDNFGDVFSNRPIFMIILLIIAEIAAIISTELYLGIFYKPAIKDLRSLLKQLDQER